MNFCKQKLLFEYIGTKLVILNMKNSNRRLRNRQTSDAVVYMTWDDLTVSTVGLVYS